MFCDSRARIFSPPPILGEVSSHYETISQGRRRLIATHTTRAPQQDTGADTAVWPWPARGMAGQGSLVQNLLRSFSSLHALPWDVG